MKKLIMTVCKGNIHRSVIAALCVKKTIKELGLESEYEIMSRGLQGSAGTDLPLQELAGSTDVFSDCTNERRTCTEETNPQTERKG